MSGATPVKEYDLYVPLTYNDGTPIEAKTIERIGQRMLERFGGVTFFPQPNEGLWRWVRSLFETKSSFSESSPPTYALHAASSEN